MTLTLLCAIPFVGAVLAALCSSYGSARFGARAARTVALVAAVATLAWAIRVLVGFHAHDGLQETVTKTWIGQLGVHWALGVDGLGLLLVLLTAVLVPIVMLAAWNDHGDRWFAWALALESFALVVFCATDVFLFYVFFEATLIPAYFMIGSNGGPQRARSALKFLMYQLGGGLVLLGGVIGLYVISAQHGVPSYLTSDLAKLPISTADGRWLFATFFVAFAVKAPIFPLHTWLADTTEQATPATSVLLVCVLDKIGTFGMIRYCLGLFPSASHWATPLVVVLALISIVYGAILAIGQDDLLRLVGLTSLSHFGFIVLGIFVLTSEGLTGSTLYMVNHGVATAVMFLVAGYLIKRRGTASISAMGGVEKSAPLLAGVFLVAGLATAGLPGLNQFVSEILVLISAFDYHWWAGAVAVTAVVLAAVYILWAYQRIFTGPARRDGDGTVDLARVELAILAPLIAALVVFGFYPSPLLRLANPTTNTVLHDVTQAAGWTTPLNGGK